MTETLVSGPGQLHTAAPQGGLVASRGDRLSLSDAGVSQRLERSDALAKEDSIERALVRLRQGKVFSSGGTDYRGGESFGGMGELRSEGEGFVLHSETWHNGTTDRSDQRMSEAELRATLASDNRVRGLLGLSSK